MTEFLRFYVDYSFIFYIVSCLLEPKEKSQKYCTLRKNQNGKPLIKWQNQKLKPIKRMGNNCHIPDLVQIFSNVENGGLNMVL